MQMKRQNKVMFCKWGEWGVGVYINVLIVIWSGVG